MAKILIVDDEPRIRELIREHLQHAGYTCEEATDGSAALAVLSAGGIDLVILDIMMPFVDGMTCLKEIRARKMNVPVIMLTARSEDTDKLLGFEYGADDYVTKPFNILELKARIRALLRRAGRSKAEAASTLTIGSISLDLDARNAYRGDTMVDLTAKEFDVIEFLMRNPNRVYSREALLDTIWAYEYRSDIRTVDVHIRRLREKLELNPAEPQYIMTKWGVGYYFRK